MGTDRTHTMRVVYAPDSRWWFAIIDGIPGILGEGETSEQAVDHAVMQHDEWSFSKLLNERQAVLHEIFVGGCGCSVDEYCDACEGDEEYIEFTPE